MPTRDLRRQLSDLEAQWEAAEGEVAATQAQLTDPATYDDHQLLRDLATRHDKAKDRATDLMAEYETVQRRLERAEAEAAAGP